jgi:hypothetical protein
VDRDALVDVAARYLSDSQRMSSIAILGPPNEKLSQDNSWTIIKETPNN